MSCLESHLFSMSIKKKKSNESCLKLLQVVKFSSLYWPSTLPASPLACMMLAVLPVITRDHLKERQSIYKTTVQDIE